MASYPFMIIYTCSEAVANVDYKDINYISANFDYEPTITAIATGTNDIDVNVFVSDITTTTARLNFSAKYTGTVKYTAILKG
jgi:hypothetical protein